MNQPMIACTGLSKSFTQLVIPLRRLQDHVLQFGRKKERMRIDAVRDVTFSIQRGEWVGIYGPNGSGKSTFLRLLSDLMVPDQGEIVRYGSISNFELGAGFHPERNAEENIYLHGLLQGMNPKEIRDLMEKTLEFADIGEHAALPMKCLSTGMAMRLSFAAAAGVDADIYLFDEVLTVGDQHFMRRCMEHLIALRGSGKTAVIVSHEMEKLLYLCDRIVFFDQGRITGEKNCVPAAAERTTSG